MTKAMPAATPHPGADEIDPEPLRESFNRIVRVAVELMGGVGGEVAIRRPGGVWRSSGRTDANAPIAPYVEQLTEPFWVEDWRKHPRIDPALVPADLKGLPFYVGAPIRLADGRVLGILSVAGAAPTPYEPGKAARLMDLAGLIADDVERRRALLAQAEAEAEAAAARATLAALVEHAPIAVSMTDRDHRVLKVSRRWREDRGMDAADVVGRTLPELFPKDDWSWDHASVLAGETVKREIRAIQPDGRGRWLRFEHAPWRDGAGQVGGILTMSVDVTELMESLQCAEASEQRLKLAMEIGELAMWEMDLRRERYAHAGVNPIESGQTLSFAELTAEGGVWQAVHPYDRPDLIAAWERHCETGEPFRATVRLMQRDGPHVWVQVAAEAVRDETGEIVRIVNVMRNVDAIKRAGINLERARDAAEAANRAKSEFLANMSHEIRTPLNGVMGVASALSRTELSSDQREMVGLIESSAETLRALLSDVLDLARIESGRLELAAAPFDLTSAVRDVGALFEPSAAAKGLSLSVDARGAAGQVVGDAPRLRQVLSNLVSNAVKFTAKGQVRIRVRTRDAGDGAAVTISVADTGIGFDKAAAARLFERFEQADGSISRRFGGAGLGLAISRSLAEAMGGRLAARARPGRGAVFTLTLALPRAAAPAAEAALALEQAPGADELGRLRVLLAEDHPTNRRVIELILGAAGVALTCVENGAEALAAWRAGGFDLVLMDMQMPVMDGLSATRAIREAERLGALPRTPIYALTANAMAEHARASAEAGVDGHLTKPISAESLLRAVSDVAAGQVAPDAARRSA